MKFLPTIDIWSPGIQEAISRGALRLQPSQWVRCGADNPHAALYAGVTDYGSLYVAHWQGSREATLARYHSLRAALGVKK